MSRSHLRGTLHTLWFYLSQVLSIIGLAGILDDLRTWKTFAEWLIDQARNLVPVLGTLVAAMFGAIHLFADAWASVLRPIFAFISGALPFEVPPLAQDVLVIALFIWLGWMRVKAFGLNRFSGIAERQRQRIRELASKHGVKLDVVPLSFYWDVETYSHWRLKSSHWRSTPTEIEQKKLDHIDTLFKNRAVDFARDIESDGLLRTLRDQDARNDTRERRLLAAVLACAALVAVALGIDVLSR